MKLSGLHLNFTPTEGFQVLFVGFIMLVNPDHPLAVDAFREWDLELHDESHLPKKIELKMKALDEFGSSLLTRHENVYLASTSLRGHM